MNIIGTLYDFSRRFLRINLKTKILSDAFSLQMYQVFTIRFFYDYLVSLSLHVNKLNDNFWA